MNDLIVQNVESLAISPLRIALDLFLVFIISRIVVWHYEKYSLSNSFSNSKNAFTIVGLSTVLIISVVKSSLALSLGLVGALSIVRFRTPIKDPEELGYLFFIIASGLAAGAEQEIALIVSTPIILFCLYLISLKKNNVGNSGMIYLEVEKNDYEKILEKLNSSNLEFNLSRFVKDNDIYSLDLKFDKLNIEKLNNVLKTLEDAGVNNVSFINNED